MKHSNYQESHPSEAQLVLALDGELDQAAAVEIALHIEGCGACREQYEQWERISQQIAKCHSAELQSLVWPQGRRSQMRKRRLIALSTIAASLAGFVWYSANPRRTVIAPSEPPRIIATAPLTPVKPNAAAVRVSRKRTAPKVARRAVDNSSDFISLPFSDGALPLNDATVVRVQLAAEDLQLAGLPIADARPGTAVQADLLIGIDGLPRAFRLIHQ